jgi:hypothetical protein
MAALLRVGRVHKSEAVAVERGRLSLRTMENGVKQMKTRAGPVSRARLATYSLRMNGLEDEAKRQT